LRSGINHAIPVHVKAIMTHQDRYDEAMFDYSLGGYDSALAKLKAILAEDASHFDAQLSLAMCYCRKGDYATAIAEGHKAEALRPKEQLVHTNLSLFYMKAGDKARAEHHVAQARLASWKETLASMGSPSAESPAGGPASPPPAPPPSSDRPWKSKTG
jgi:predicted Zn-dependent protease